MDAKTKTIFVQITREIGSKGGKIGGKRSLETMTAEQRTARQESLRSRGAEAHGRANREGTGG